MENLAKLIGGMVLIGAMVAIAAVIFALPLMMLWNALMPDIFGLKVLTFWQALGLNMMAGILFNRSSSSKSE